MKVNMLGLAGWEPFSDGSSENVLGNVKQPTINAKKRASASAPALDTYGFARSVSGSSRVTYDTPQDMFASALQTVAPFSADRYWRDLVLDKDPMSKISPWKLMELMADVSPEISRALSDFVLMCNPGYEARAVRPGTDDQDKEAQKELDSILATLRKLYGSPKVVIDRLFTNAALRGAFFSEAVLDEAGRELVDLVTPDPAYVAFRRVPDPIRGAVWQLGQWQNGQFVVLDRPTISYIPIQPLPGRPEGRPLFSSALFCALFLLGVLHDLRRVIQQQGYPRIDIEIDLEKLRDSMPEDMGSDPQEFMDWAEGVVKLVQSVYSGLEPDDAYIHASFIQVNKQTVGATNTSSLGAIDGLFKALERMTTRAAKSMPLLMATTDGVSEANANRQWEIYAAFIKSIQQLGETMLEHQFGLAMQAKGVYASVDFKFAELRAAELLRDAQVELLNTQTARMQYDNGSISADEMAQKSAGKAKADAPAPRQAPSPGNNGATDAANTNPDPGSNRKAQANGHRTFSGDLVDLVRRHTSSTIETHTVQ
ncbi:MAG TPA: hypothetical protein VF717_09390 [Pyrinomonadaceae bacterium]|jgi:hypothetical protein